MNQREARVFAELVGRAFFLHSHDGHRVFMLKKEDSDSECLVEFGPYINKVGNTAKVCGFLNEEYARTRQGKAQEGTYYGDRLGRVRFCGKSNFPSESDEVRINSLHSNNEAERVGEALNEVRKLALEDMQSAEQ